MSLRALSIGTSYSVLECIQLN